MREEWQQQEQHKHEQARQAKKKEKTEMNHDQDLAEANINRWSADELADIVSVVYHQLCLTQTKALELVGRLDKLQRELSRRLGLQVSQSKLPLEVREMMEKLMADEQATTTSAEEQRPALPTAAHKYPGAPWVETATARPASPIWRKQLREPT